MTSCFSRRPVERRAMFFFFFLFLSVMGSSSGVCVDGACVVMYYLPSFFFKSFVSFSDFFNVFRFVLDVRVCFFFGYKRKKRKKVLAILKASYKKKEGKECDGNDDR